MRIAVPCSLLQSTCRPKVPPKVVSTCLFTAEQCAFSLLNNVPTLCCKRPHHSQFILTSPADPLSAHSPSSLIRDCPDCSHHVSTPLLLPSARQGKTWQPLSC